MPGISSLFNKSGVVGKIFQGGARKSINQVMSKMDVSKFMRASSSMVGAAFDASMWLNNKFMRTGARAVGWGGKHYVGASTIGIGLVTATGMARGVMDTSKALKPQPLPNRALPPGQGPGYRAWSTRGGMNPLGADGNLTLSLSKLRHR